MQVVLGCCSDVTDRPLPTEPTATTTERPAPGTTRPPLPCRDHFDCIRCICEIEDLIRPDDVDRYVTEPVWGAK